MQRAQFPLAVLSLLLMAAKERIGKGKTGKEKGEKGRGMGEKGRGVDRGKEEHVITVKLRTLKVASLHLFKVRPVESHSGARENIIAGPYHLAPIL